MDFQEFQDRLESELRKDMRYFTMAQNKGFKANLRRDNSGELMVIITLDSGKERGHIYMREFRGIWDSAKPYSPETRFINRGGRLGSYIRKDGQIGKTTHIAYIAKLIQHVVKDQKME